MLSSLFNILLRTVLLNPMILLGVGASLYLLTHFSVYQIKNFLHTPKYYLILWGITLVYSLLFKRVYSVYNSKEEKINWIKTAGGSITEFIIVIASAAATIFIYAFYNEIDLQEFDNYLRNK